MPRITALTPSRRNATKLIISVDGKAIGTLPAKQVESLGLEVGGQWREADAAKVAELVAFEKAFEQAMKLVNCRPVTRAALVMKMIERGHDSAVAERVAAKLVAIGAMSDEALAAALLEEIDRTRPAGPALKRAKLAQRGVEEEVIERLVEASSTPADQREAAKRLVASKQKAFARLDEATRKRRLWGLLARRGFEEDVIEAVLGAGEED